MPEVKIITLKDFQRLKEEFDTKQKEKEANKDDNLTRNKSNKVGGKRKKNYVVPSFF